MPAKAGKNQCELKSYRPISLFSVLNKVLQKLLRCKILHLLPLIALPEHLFDCYAHHSTVDQLQRVTSTILCNRKQKEFYAATFLHVAQAFYLVRHESLTVKLSHRLLSNICHLLHNCLSEHRFCVIYGAYSFSPRPFTAGVPPRGYPRTNLYTLYTGDFPTPADTTVATFADDIAILATFTDYPLIVGTL